MWEKNWLLCDWCLEAVARPRQLSRDRGRDRGSENCASRLRRGEAVSRGTTSLASALEYWYNTPSTLCVCVLCFVFGIFWPSICSVRMSIQVLQTTLLEPNGISNQKMSKACVSTNVCPVYPQNTWLMSLTVQYSIMLEKKGWGGGGGSGYEGRSHDHKPVWTWDMNSLTQLRRVYESLVLVCEVGVSPSVYSAVCEWGAGGGLVGVNWITMRHHDQIAVCVLMCRSVCSLNEIRHCRSAPPLHSCVCVCLQPIYQYFRPLPTRHPPNFTCHRTETKMASRTKTAKHLGNGSRIRGCSLFK